MELYLGLGAGAKQIQWQLKRLRERNRPGACCRNKLGGAPSAFEQGRRASGGVGRGGNGCSSAAVIETWGCPNCQMKEPRTALRLQVCQRFC